jgi:hypothetical protein
MKNDLVQIILEGNSKIGQEVLKMAEAASQVIAEESKKFDPKSPYIEGLKSDLMLAMQRDVWELLKVEKERNAQEMQKLAERYQNEWKARERENRQKIADYDLKLSAMTPRELELEMNKYLENEGAIDPLLIDTLSIHVKQELPDLHESLRKIANERHYNEPWRLTAEGKFLDEEARVLENCDTNEFPVSMKSQNGELHTIPISISDVVEF